MTAPVPSRRRMLSLAACVMPLTGCSLLFAQPASRLYRLAPQTEGVPNSRPVHQQLVIVLPVSPQSLDTDRIALTRNRDNARLFRGCESGPIAPPYSLQGLLIRAFEDSGRIIAVGRDLTGLTPDYLLETELREFEARYGEAGSQPPTVDGEFGRQAGQDARSPHYRQHTRRPNRRLRRATISRALSMHLIRPSARFLPRSSSGRFR